MGDYYHKTSDLTFSLYESKVMYNLESGSRSEKKECTEYWFNQQNTFSLDEFIFITNKVSGSSTYIRDNNWRISSNLILTESDAINAVFPNDNTKTISNTIDNFKISNDISEDEAEHLLKSNFENVYDWSF